MARETRERRAERLGKMSEVEWREHVEDRIASIRRSVLLALAGAFALYLVLGAGLLIYRADQQERRDQECRKDERLYLRQAVGLKETYRFLTKSAAQKRLSPEQVILLDAVFRQLPTIEEDARKKRLTVIPVCDEPGFGLPETKEYEPNLPERKTFSGLKRRVARAAPSVSKATAGGSAAVISSPLAQELAAERRTGREPRPPDPSRPPPDEAGDPDPAPVPTPPSDPPPPPANPPTPNILPNLQVCTMVVRVNCSAP